MTKRRITGTEIIAEFFLMDIAEIRDYEYQPKWGGSAKVYSFDARDFDFVCCPRKGQKPPKGFVWQPIGTSHIAPDRPIYGHPHGVIAE